MQFYALDTFPKGEAETCAAEEKGYRQGDAPHCPVCGRPVGMLTWLPPLRAVLQLFGTSFGDFAFMGASDDFLVSEKFRNVYDRHHLSGLAGFDPVEVVKVKSRRKVRSTCPSYFRVSVHYGGPALDLAASEIEWFSPPKCPTCRSSNLIRWKRLVVEEGTWTGQDAFRPRGMSGETMVSQRFKDVCEEHGITNAVFIPAEQAGHDFYPGMKDPSELDAFRR